MRSEVIIGIFLLITGLVYLYMRKVKKNHHKVVQKTLFVRPLNHPVLEYQRIASAGQIPATLGDPIRPSTGSTIGPISQIYKAYGLGESYGWNQAQIPVQRGVLKMTSEKYKYPFYYQQVPLAPYDYFKPYGPNVGASQMQKGLKLSDTPFYDGGVVSGQSFIGSVNAFAPFPEVNTPWEKTGILTTTNKDDDSILNVYRRPIAPLQDLFRYMVQDKNGFLINLKDGLLENGDIVVVPGKESKGTWEFKDYTMNKYIWV